MAVLREVNSDRIFSLGEKTTVIGRDPTCDIVLHSAQTSGRHALIVQSGNAFYIEDLDSVNGTWVNGERIRERTLLRANDRLDIHGLAATFLVDPAPVSTVPAGVVAIKAASPGVPILSSLDLASQLRVQVDPATKLRAVLEITTHLGATLDLREVLPKILDSLFTIFPQADRGIILLIDAETGQLTPGATRLRRDDDSGRLTYSQTVVGHALASGQAVLSADTGADLRFDPSQSIRSLQIRSLMCVPLLGSGGTRLGVIQMDTRNPRSSFRQDDLDVLVSAAAQAARAVELASLHRARLDLEAATRIQQSFLPDVRPSVPGLEFYDHYEPAQQVGGDYYDYIRLPGNRLAVAIGDVSGKGVSAALLMARLSSAVRFALATAPSLAEAVRELNTTLIRPGSEDRFVTFVVMVLDLDGGTMTLVNAGHLPPLRHRRATLIVEEIGGDVAGLPLGVFDRPYEEFTIPLEPGDTLVLCTDGVTEARNPKGDFYGNERLRRVVRTSTNGVGALGASLIQDVKEFAAGRSPADDVTVVCFGKT